MSEQKMPALPERDGQVEGALDYHDAWFRDTVELIRAEAVEFGRQQERERLEPLRAAVEAEAISRAQYDSGLISFADVAYLRRLVTDAARTLLEQTE